MPLSPQATPITLTIGGVDKTSLLRQGSVSITMRLNQRWEASFDLYHEEGSFSDVVGKNVILEDDGRAFTGKLEEVEEFRAVDNSSGTEMFYRIRCVDLMSRLDQRVWSEPSTHLNKTAGYVVNLALSLFAYAEGITFSPAASPGGFIEDGADVEKFVGNKQNILEVIEQMCQLSDYVAYVDVNGDFHFEPAGASYAAPFSISATSANFSKISLRRSKSEGAGGAGSGYFNQSWTRTAWAAWEQRHNSFTGDGSTTEWALYDPDNVGTPMAAAIVVDVKVNGKSVDIGGEEEGRAYTWYYGESRLVLAAGEAVPVSDDTIEVWFHSIDQGYIFVQDLSEITARGTIEGNTGQCARIFDDSHETNFQAATDKAQAKLDIAKHIVDVVTLEANGFGANPIFPRPGMLFAATLSYPSISGNFIILEVSAREAAGAGLRYSCKCVKQGSSRRLANGIDYFRELARKKPGTSIAGGAGDGGPKSGPISYMALIKDATVRDNAADVVSVYGATIQQASKIRRIQAVPRITLTSDLTVEFINVETDGATAHSIGQFTLPAGSDEDVSVAFDEFDWATLADKSVLKINIIASGAEKDRDGVASFRIETVGRGTSELPVAEGLSWMGEYSAGATYEIGDLVESAGSSYISLQTANIGHTPASSPTYWDLVAQKGDTGAAGADGADGVGVPTGGSTGQSLVKASGTDYDTTWADRVAPARSIATTAPLTGGGDLSADRTLAISNFTGDSGSGGAKGAVPAPGAGDAAAGKFLKADATWAVPPGGVSASRNINTTAPITGGGDLSADRTIAISDFTGDSGSGGAKGAVPAPAAGDAAAGKFLKASGGWAVPSGGGSGTVTHTGGALTSDLPIFGAGSDDVKTGTKSGNTNKVVTQGAGSPSTGQPLLYDASGNAIPGTTAQLVPTLPADATKYLDGTGAFTVPTGSGGGAWGSITGTLTDQSEIDTDGALAANSDLKLATQKAIRTYVSSSIGGTTPDNLLAHPLVIGASPWQYNDMVPYSAIANLLGNFRATRLLMGTGNGYMRQPFGLPAGTFQLQVTVKKITGQWFLLALSDFTANSFGKFFDLTNGVVGTTNAAGTGSYVSSSILSLGSGWYTVTVTGSLSASIALSYFEMQPATADNTYSSTSGHDHYVVDPSFKRTV